MGRKSLRKTFGGKGIMLSNQGKGSCNKIRLLPLANSLFYTDGMLYVVNKAISNRSNMCPQAMIVGSCFSWILLRCVHFAPKV